jgi:hypothetical protein
MNITRVQNPEISVHLLPWYVEDDKTALEIGMELNDRMTDCPDETCVLVATDKGHLKAVLIGYIENDYLFVWQAKKSKDMNRPHLIFHKMCEWGKSKGVEKARLGTSNKRVRRMYKRKYGFTPIGEALMEKSI